MIGLGSIEIALAFWCSIGSAVLCIGYGILNWNKQGKPDRVTTRHKRVIRRDLRNTEETS